MTHDSYHNDNDLLSDEDLELLTNYVGGCLTADEEEAFDDRMVDDDAFFERMAPMVKQWYSPPTAVIEAGARMKARVAARRSREQLWRRHVAIAAQALLAASVIFEIAESGVLQMAFGGHAHASPAVLQAKGPTKTRRDSQAITVASLPKPPVHHAAPHPKATRFALQPPRKDTTAERVIAELAAAPVPDASVTPSSAPRVAQPVVPHVPRAKGHAPRDTIDVGSDPVIQLSVPSKLAALLGRLFHWH